MRWPETSFRIVVSNVGSRTKGALVGVLSLALAGCGGTLDAGQDNPREPLPVDASNPVVICNDGPDDNLQGEYAMLLANGGGPPLAGIIVTTGGNWPNIDENLAGWREMVAAARDGGLPDIPDPVASDAPVLVRPSDGDIDSTAPNQSAGAQFILDAAERLGRPDQPLVIATGGRLTEVADAYLMDHSLPDRVVVVASLGSVTPDGGDMGVPNGEQDTWAGVIVAQRFRYVQVSAFYDQLADVAESRIAQLPINPFTSWLQSKRTTVWDIPPAADQVSVLTVALPEFVTSVTRVVQVGEDSDGYPALSEDSEGPAWLVEEVNGDAATSRLWELLLDPAMYRAE